MENALFLALAGGIFLMAAGQLLADWALRALNTPASILAQALVYIRIYLLAIMSMIVYNMCAGILRLSLIHICTWYYPLQLSGSRWDGEKCDSGAYQGKGCHFAGYGRSFFFICKWRRHYRSDLIRFRRRISALPKGKMCIRDRVKWDFGDQRK